MTDSELVLKGRAWLEQKYPGYLKKPARERRVLAAGYLCDVVKPREKTGKNDGPEVEAILMGAGLRRGNPWCAAAQIIVARMAAVWSAQSALVADWRNAARRGRRTIDVKDVQRGDLVTALYKDGTGHIGIVLAKVKIVGNVGWVHSIEGNTGPGEEGSQRDGQGMYRRWRKISFWHDAMLGA